MRSLAVLGVALAASSMVGCGGGEHRSVSGVVTLDGVPLDAGTVLFQPIGEGRPARGAIGPGGQYQLQSDGQPGVRPGEYAVAVLPEGLSGGEDSPPAGPSAPVPAHYHTPATSNLTYTVQERGEHHFDLPLTTKP